MTDHPGKAALTAIMEAFVVQTSAPNKAWSTPYAFTPSALAQIAAYVADLEARAALAEAALAKARDDALEEGAASLWLAAEHARRKLGAVTDEQGRGSVNARCWSAIVTHLLIERDAIRALKGRQA